MITVDTVGSRAQFLALEHEWNDTVARAGVTHPFLRHEWLRAWLDCFGNRAQLHTLVARTGGRIQAIAPLLAESGTMYGVPIRRIRLMHNDHTPRADMIVCKGADDARHAIWKTLFETRDHWDVLQLEQLPRESPTRTILTELAGADGCSSGVWQSGASPYLKLSGTWDTYTATLSTKFRQNLRNRLTRLRQVGEPALETISADGDVDAAVDDVVRIEEAAWKRDEGTSISSHAAVDRLYRTFAKDAASRDWLRIFFLTVGGTRIATSYSLCYENRLFLFKTGYDPGYAKCSPFKLLTHVILRDAFARGLSEVDFLGDPEPWKLDWTVTTRPHDWLFVFSNSMRARLLRPVKFNVVPALRRYRPTAAMAW